MSAEFSRPIPGRRSRKNPALLAMACACMAFCLPMPAGAQEEKPKDDRECLTVELVMFSGRPRPRYLICEEAGKKQALELIAEADEEKPAEMEFPKLPNDPNYQGLLIGLPVKGDAIRARLLLRKGFVKPLGGKSIRLDKGRKLETYFLRRSLKEKDLSRASGQGDAIGKLSESILADLEREGGPE